MMRRVRHGHGGEGDGQKVAAVESRRVHVKVYAGASPLPTYLPPRPHPCTCTLPVLVSYLKPTITKQQSSWTKQLRYRFHQSNGRGRPKPRSAAREHAYTLPTRPRPIIHMRLALLWSLKPNITYKPSAPLRAMASRIRNMASDNSTQVELAQYTQNPFAASSTDVQPLPNGTFSPDSHEGFSLPPTDTGKDAWLFLLACFMLEALIWGTSRTDAPITCHLTTLLLEEHDRISGNISVVMSRTSFVILHLLSLQ
jgi:hypothetical protein